MGMNCGFKGIVILNDDAFNQLVALQHSEFDTGFHLYAQLLGLSNHSFSTYFGEDEGKPYCLINMENKAIQFCTSFNLRHMSDFVQEIKAASTSVLMSSVEESMSCENIEKLYLKNPFMLNELFSDEVDAFWQFNGLFESNSHPLTDGIYVKKENQIQAWGYGIEEVPDTWKLTHDENWLNQECDSLV